MSYNIMKVNALDWFTNLVEENRNITSLGFGKRIKKKFDEVDAVGNVSLIQFEDPEIERICHEHGVYTINDTREVSSINDWFVKNKIIKSFNELKYFTRLKEIDNYSFSACVNLQSISIPDSVTSIGFGAFSYCDSLQSINIPNSVANIVNYAFHGCKSLQSVIIPDSVTSIGGGAFMYCESLQSITIPDSVTSIGEHAFKGCKSLQSVTIPDSVTEIGYSAFLSCGLLKIIYISKNCHVYNQIRKVYPNIQLVEPKVNESSNLGLASKVKKSFTGKSEEDIVKNASQITQETLVDLYDSWGHVQTDYQGLKFPTLRTWKDFRLCSARIGRSYSKFIYDMTDGTVVCKFSASSWGEEKLDAIEFWHEGDKKLLKNRLYGEEKYSVEYVDSFYKNKKNYILDWFIPATLRFLEKYPEYIGRFYAKLIK